MKNSLLKMKTVLNMCLKLVLGKPIHRPWQWLELPSNEHTASNWLQQHKPMDTTHTLHEIRPWTDAPIIRSKFLQSPFHDPYTHSQNIQYTVHHVILAFANKMRYLHSTQTEEFRISEMCSSVGSSSVSDDSDWESVTNLQNNKLAGPRSLTADTRLTRAACFKYICKRGRTTVARFT